jgi:ParB-like chromosome segregation protein Spo0J
MISCWHLTSPPTPKGDGITEAFFIGLNMNNDLFESEISLSILNECNVQFKKLLDLDIQSKVEIINKLRFELHQYSPFKSEPVDCVLWVKSEIVGANDYNPNSVAPPEMKLLEHSISEDGYTQPIVAWSRDNFYEVIDGFHRHRVGKESEIIKNRVHGYLPIVPINNNRNDKSDRMASTIRHNRARGEHKVESMAEIVIELKRRFWSDEKIAIELGMDSDEVLRLQQITGLAGLFADRDFSQAWEATSTSEIEGDNILDE